LALLCCVAGVIVIPAVMVATPYLAFIDRAYPVVAAEQQPFQISFRPIERKDKDGWSSHSGRKVAISLPFEANVPSDEIVMTAGAMLTLQLPEGTKWNSEWHSVYKDLQQGRQRLSVGVEIDRELYERVKNDAIPVRLTLATTELRDRSPQQITVDYMFTVPGVGTCWPEREGYTVHCRSTGQSPEYILLTVDPDASTCPAESHLSSSEDEPKDEREDARSVSRYLNSDSFSGEPLTLLSVRPFYLRNWSEGTPDHAPVCPGTKVVFSAPELVKRSRIEMDLGAIKLKDYGRPTIE
jgi:hypothetical protein